MEQSQRNAEIRNAKSVSALINEENFWCTRSEKSSDDILFDVQYEALRHEIFKNLYTDACVFKNSSVIDGNRPASLYQAF